MCVRRSLFDRYTTLIVWIPREPEIKSRNLLHFFFLPKHETERTPAKAFELLRRDSRFARAKKNQVKIITNRREWFVNNLCSGGTRWCDWMDVYNQWKIIASEGRKTVADFAELSWNFEGDCCVGKCKFAEIKTAANQLVLAVRWSRKSNSRSPVFGKLGPSCGIILKVAVAKFSEKQTKSQN